MRRLVFRGLALLLLAVFLLALFPLSAFAAEPESAEVPEAASGTDFFEHTVEISSPEEFFAFAEGCSLDSFSQNTRFVLTADLDLSGSHVAPIQLFQGSFEGGGHSIRGLDLTGDGSRQGLFRRVLAPGEVKDLFVYGSVRPGGTAQFVGGIAGENSGTIHNCAFIGEVAGRRFVGGIAGKNAGTLSHCSFSGTLTGERDAGGIAGTSTGAIWSCANSGAVCSTPIDVLTETEFNINTFDISQLTTEDFVNISNIGGIVGSSSGTVMNCENQGIVGYKYQGFNVGGIAGKTSGYLCTSRNLGPVWGQRDVGGIAGQLEPYVSMVFSEDLLNELQTEMDALNRSVNAISGSINSSLGAGAETISQMASYSRALAEQIVSIVPTEGIPDLPDLPTPGDGEINFPDFPVIDTPDFSQITANLDLLMNGSTQLISLMGSAASGVTGALRSVNTHANAIQAILRRAVENASPDRDLTEDISVQEAYNIDTGAIADCENTGTVLADTNAGGILGICAVELSFDVAGQLDFSSYLYTDTKTTFFSVVRGCLNTGDVTVRDSYAGGIAGRMTQGTVAGCGNSSAVRCENGDYCGGITGLSNGTVFDCYARSSVSGSKYLGGICGSGVNILTCLSHVKFTEGSEFLGAIAGWAEGDLSENRFLTNPAGGIDGASYAGKAEPIDVLQLRELEEVPDYFQTVSIRFIHPDGTETVRSVRLGGKLRGTPRVARDSKGQPWEWDDAPDGPIYENATVTGHYAVPIPVLTSQEDRPVYLVEGVFSEEQTLSVLDPESPWPDSVLPDPILLRSAALLVEGYGADLTVHMLAPSNGTLHLLRPDGSWEPADYEADGSYVVFRLPNGGTFAYTEISLRSFPLAPVCIGAGVLIAGSVTLLLLLRKKRRKALQRSPEESLTTDKTDGSKEEKPSV